MSTIQKPRHGEPCNRCGACCESELCPLASEFFALPEEDGPCPALLFDPDRRSRCGLVDATSQFAPVKCAVHGTKTMSDAAALLIGAGHGCDAQLDDEIYNAEFGRRMRAESDLRKAQISNAVTLWLF